MSTTPSTATAAADPTGPSPRPSAAAAVPRPPRPAPQWWRDAAGAADLALAARGGRPLAGRGRSHRRALRRRGAHLARAGDRPGRLGPAARPGAADGADPAGRAQRRPGRAGPVPPAGRLHVVQPDGAHVVPITLGYAAATAASSGAPSSTSSSTTRACCSPSPARRACVMVVVTSIRAARRRLRYESWHLLHLYAYLGVGLALPHQLWTGQEFLTSPVATVYWWSAVCRRPPAQSWSGGSACRSTAACVTASWSPGRPARAHGVTTVTVGRPAPAPAAGAGRGSSCTGGSSAAPAGPGRTRTPCPRPRTGAACGSPSSTSATAAPALSRLQPGTRVIVEGPYGRLHAGVRTRAKVTADRVGHRHHPDARPAGGPRAAARRRHAHLPRPQRSATSSCATSSIALAQPSGRAALHRHRLARARTGTAGCPPTPPT